MLEQAWSAYGFRLGYRGDLDLRPHVPPNWLPVDFDENLAARVEARGWEILDEGNPWTVARDAEQLVMRLLQLLQMRLTWGVAHYTFLHAGVVRMGEGGWLLPGAAGSGKSQLVLALLEAGGQFYSDELAVLDDGGQVHAYPRDLWLRISKKQRRRISAPELGWTPELQPMPVDRVLLCSYTRGSVWDPRELSWPEAFPLLATHLRCSPAARKQACARLERALGQARIRQGKRGEAADLVASEIC